jgi:hypothetical protein
VSEAELNKLEEKMRRMASDATFVGNAVHALRSVEYPAPTRKVTPMSDTWTPEFRLAVIRRIAAVLRSYVGGTTCVESASVYRDVSALYMVSFGDSRDINRNTTNIEAALGCTLEDDT